MERKIDEIIIQFYNTRYDDEKAICEKYEIFPKLNEWKNKILFLETCELKSKPEEFEKELLALKNTGIFDVISGIMVGKPQDEQYYEEYKEIYCKTIENKDLPIIYNVNFGHAQPRCIIQYGIETEIDWGKKVITLNKLYEGESLGDGDSPSYSLFTINDN
ncbi:MAG: hypothetical protein P4L60_04520 [Clostridium sp.]|nr:hypothetical protein [Clostridium sp.]